MFVVGADSDTARTAGDTVAFAERYRIDSLMLNVLTPGIGTKQYEMMNGDERVFERRWQFYDGQHVIFTPQNMTASQLQTEVIDGYRRFYSVGNILEPLVRLRLGTSLERLWGRLYIHRWQKDPTNRAYVQALGERSAGASMAEDPSRQSAKAASA